MDALQNAGLYNNILNVFSTDNIGAGWASNFTVKEMKNTLYEGGMRGVGMVHSSSRDRGW